MPSPRRRRRRRRRLWQGKEPLLLLLLPSLVSILRSPLYILPCTPSCAPPCSLRGREGEGRTYAVCHPLLPSPIPFDEAICAGGGTWGRKEGRKTKRKGEEIGRGRKEGCFCSLHFLTQSQDVITGATATTTITSLLPSSLLVPSKQAHHWTNIADCFFPIHLFFFRRRLCAECSSESDSKRKIFRRRNWRTTKERIITNYEPTGRLKPFLLPRQSVREGERRDEKEKSSIKLYASSHGRVRPIPPFPPPSIPRPPPPPKTTR